MGSRRAKLAMVCSILCLGSLAGCSSDSGRQPDRAEDRIALISSIHRQLDLLGGHERLRGVLVLYDGKPVLENYEEWPPSTYWDIGWITTTVLTTLVGIAIGEGRIPGVQATLRELLPEHAADMRPDVASTTLQQVLTMTGGFHPNDHDPVLTYMGSPDPVARILRAADQTLGTFEYSTQGAHLLAAILARATDQSVLQYARSRLFDPLGIDSTPAYTPLADDSNAGTYAKADFAWPVDSTGLHLGWGFLKLRPMDVARIGQLYADDGKWKDEEVVPASWIRESTAAQVTNTKQPGGPLTAWSGYGYGWWRIDVLDKPAYFTADLSGQLLEVVPNRDLVVVVASEVEYDAPGGSSGLAPDALTFLVNDVIAPTVGAP